MLDVLVTGFPNSGTSFMLEFVKEATGLSPGSECNLKGADSHNRYGYWEHLPIRNVSWSLIGGGLNVRNLPEEPLPRSEQVAKDILYLAERDNVQVYKDNALPIVYRSFPEGAKVVWIARHSPTIWERYYQDMMSWRVFDDIYMRWIYLGETMLKDMDMQTFNYDNFADEFKYQATRVCEFLGVPYREELREIWRPRKQS